MTFEWDGHKAAHDAVKHGVEFEYAARVFLDPQRMDREDARRGRARIFVKLLTAPRPIFVRNRSAQ